MTKALIRKIIILLIVIMQVGVSIGAVPVITSHNNTKTNSDRYAIINVNEIIGFNITSTGATSYSWRVDDADQNRNFPNFSTSWTSASGSPHYVIAYATNSDGTASYEFRVSIQKTKQSVTATVAKMNTSNYNQIRDSTKSYDFQGFIKASVLPYTALIGNVFYLFIWLVIFSMYWIRQGSITIPSVLGLILGGAVIGMLPEEYHLYVWAIIGLSGGALLLKLYLESR